MKAIVELENSPFRYLLESIKKLVNGWIKAKGGLQDGVGICLKYLKRGWNRKEGKENKDFKKRGQAGPMGGCFKMEGGLEPPYRL